MFYLLLFPLLMPLQFLVLGLRMVEFLVFLPLELPLRVFLVLMPLDGAVAPGPKVPLVAKKYLLGLLLQLFLK